MAKTKPVVKAPQKGKASSKPKTANTKKIEKATGASPSIKVIQGGVEGIAPQVAQPVKVETATPQAVAETKPKKTPKVSGPSQVTRGGYAHFKVGLKVNDVLVFRPNDKVRGVVTNDFKGVKINGQEFNGISVAEKEAYGVAEMPVPAGRLYGWGWDILREVTSTDEEGKEKTEEVRISLRDAWEKLPTEAEQVKKGIKTPDTETA